MRNALLAVVAVVAAVVAGWILDDKLLGGDIARNTSIAGVDVGRLDIDEAAELLTDGRLTDRPIELRHDTNTLTITAAELGVMVDAELALADAAEQPDLIAQPIRWIGSLFGNRSFDVRYTVDVDVLGGNMRTVSFKPNANAPNALQTSIHQRMLTRATSAGVGDDGTNASTSIRSAIRARAEANAPGRDEEPTPAERARARRAARRRSDTEKDGT